MKFPNIKILWLVALIGAVALVWCVNNDRTSAAKWAMPVEYGFDSHGGDSLCTLGYLRAAADGDFVPFRSKTITRLGAPYAGNWNDFPIFDEILLFTIGVCARVFGFFQATNLALVLGHVSSAVAFYYCCRLLRYNRLWAWVGAILFAFTYYTSYRGLSHLTLAYIYSVPLAVVCAWLVGSSRRLEWGNKFCWFCLVVSVVVGLSFPYHLNMFCQLLAIALVLQFFTRRRKQNLQIGAAALGLAVAAFVAVNLDTFSYSWAHGKNPDPMERNYYESEMFALKPMELMVPPASHHVASLAAVGRQYNGILMMRGEVFSPYLGMAGVVGLCWLFVEGIRFAMKRPRRRFPVHGLQSAWIVFYSMNGGLNCLFAFAGFAIFRATNRFSVFLSAIALLFLVSRLSVLSRCWQPALRVIAAGALLFVGLYDQLPRPSTPAEVSAYRDVVDNDRTFTEKMEASLPPKAMVFQTPAMVFPESLSRHQVMPYEYFRPYLNSKALRFSFGNNKGRPIDNWQYETEKLPAPQMVAALEKYGFAAIHIFRRAFPDRGEALLKQLAAAGKTTILEDGFQDQVCVLLTPSPNPEKPPGADELAVEFPRHLWQKPEGSPPDRQVWSNGDAKISFYNPNKKNSPCRIKGAIGSLSRRHVNVQMGGREIWNAQLNPNQAVPVEFVVDAKPGYNVVEIKSDEPPVGFPGQPQHAPAAFVAINLRATPVK